MSEVQEIFQELFFGGGAWLGLILILALIFLAGNRNKYLNLLFIPVLGFLSLLYLDNVAVSSNFMWSALICFMAMPLLLVQFVKQK